MSEVQIKKNGVSFRDKDNKLTEITFAEIQDYYHKENQKISTDLEDTKPDNTDNELGRQWWKMIMMSISGGCTKAGNYNSTNQFKSETQIG